MLTVVIFMAIIVYNLRSPKDHTDRLYWFLLFLLEGVLIGLFLTRDFFNIFVLVEVSTVVVTILLMFDRRRRNLKAGMTFIMINIVVMQFYLFGLGYLYFLTGVLDIEAAAVALQELDRADVVLPYALIMTSIAAKCSLLPLLTFLPKVNALIGSRFTIAAIMSGLHIKSGVYLFIRFTPIFGDMGMNFFLVMGLVTAFGGIILALAQKDIRLILAYSTIAQVGLIIAGFSLGDAHSYIGSVFHVVNHALLKSALFIGAGMITFLYRTRDITKIRGLLRADAWLGAAHALAILGMIGAPLFNGFTSKYFLMYGAGGALEWVFVVVNAGTMLVFVRYGRMFFGRPIQPPQDIENDWCRHSVVLALGLGGLALGIGGTPLLTLLTGQDIAISLSGFVQKSAIFLATLAGAMLLYRHAPEKAEPLKRLRNLELGFKPLCVSIGVFFAGLLVYVGWVV